LIHEHKKASFSSSFLYFAAFMLLLLLAPTTLNAQSNAAGKQVFDILKYGAKGDGVNLDSPAIQKAIDEATKAGNGAQVLIPGGHRYLVGTIQLKSNIDFHLDGDAELYVSTNPKDYINDAVIIANDVNDLKISGTGSINGRALEFMTHYSKETEIYMPATWRPKIFILTNVRILTSVISLLGLLPTGVCICLGVRMWSSTISRSETIWKSLIVMASIPIIAAM